MGPVALVRRPSPRLAEGIVTHLDRRPVDLALARAQWEGYATAFAAHGWAVAEAPPADDCPDGVFVEDPVLVYRDTAVLLRSGAPARRAETAGLAATLDGYGYRIAEISAPGTVDGGDVLACGDQVWIGASGRTDADGAAQLGAVLTPRGARVRVVPVTRVLHLKSAVTALPDGTVLGYPPLVDDPGVWERFLAVPEEPGAHVVVLDAETVLLSAAAPRTAALLRARGLAVVPVDISEYEKLEGCVTCLSVRLRTPGRP